MTLQPDRSLAHYRLIEKIGEGGMGAVWKAVDTTLDREVAIKLLPDGLASDGDRLERFEREAKLLASLNHPNIATLHGLHDADGLRFLSMELVPGEDLSKRLTRGKLALDEALTLARQIAGALEAAHAAGIIHRDLKPANIQITPDGNVRVLDFGLAKALGTPLDAADSDDVVTVTSEGTVVGTVLGTAAYMSPEQARGLPVDRRTDLWAFGCVLYEMLTRSRPFVGRTVTDTLAAVLEREPDWSALPAATPPAIRRLLRRCLQKQQERRLRDIADARLEIDDALEPDEVGRPSPSSVESDTIASASSWSRRALPWLAVGALLGLAIGWVLVSFRGSPRIETETHAVMRFAVQASQGAGNISNFAPASDDSYVVYWSSDSGHRSAPPQSPLYSVG